MIHYFEIGKEETDVRGSGSSCYDFEKFKTFDDAMAKFKSSRFYNYLTEVIFENNKYRSRCYDFHENKWFEWGEGL